MKWLDKKIDDCVAKRMESQNSALDDFESKLRTFRENFEELDKSFALEKSETFDTLRKLNEDIHILREKMELESRRVNLRMDEKDKLLRENMETCFTGLIMRIDNKLSLLGDKKGIVTDLLKRIAYLEGQVQDAHK